MNPELVIKHPKVNKNPIIKVIRQMSFIPDEYEKNTKKNSLILFQENYSKKIEKQSLIFERRILFYINKNEFQLEIQVGTRDSHGNIRGLPSCFRDLITMKFYTSTDDYGKHQIKEYVNTEGFFKKFPFKTINLNSNFNGTYLIASNSFIFANITNSNKIGKFSVEDGALAETLVLNDALFQGKASLNCGGYQDICLLQDEATNSFYVFYQIKDQLKSILSEITLFPKMKLKKSWEIPFQKNQIGFCLTHDNLLYLGFINVKSYIPIAYDLIGECIRIIPEIVLPSSGIKSINYFANLDMIIIGENEKIIKLYGTTK